MVDYSDTIMSIASRMDEKVQKRLKPDVLARLNRKLMDVGDEEDHQLLHRVYQQLRDIGDDITTDYRPYKKSLWALQKSVRSKYGFTEKGTLQNESTGIGIAFGTAIGGGFVGINPAFVGIGIPIGLAIGVAIGKQREEQAEEQGKTY
jgi:hypothetical protein